MERRGCALVQNLSGDSELLKFNINWTYCDLDNRLCERFPQPFGHIDDYFHQYESKRSVNRPVWVLVSREQGCLETIDVEYPNGADVFRYKGKGHSKSPNAANNTSYVVIGKIHFITT